MFVQRSLGSGYAGIDKTLFYKDGTMMLFATPRRSRGDRQGHQSLMSLKILARDPMPPHGTQAPSATDSIQIWLVAVWCRVASQNAFGSPLVRQVVEG
nr:hypothetical protein [Sinorhizobium americanum]